MLCGRTSPNGCGIVAFRDRPGPRCGQGPGGLRCVGRDGPLPAARGLPPGRGGRGRAGAGRGQRGLRGRGGHLDGGLRDVAHGRMGRDRGAHCDPGEGLRPRRFCGARARRCVGGKFSSRKTPKMAINRDFPGLRAFSGNVARDKIEEREIPHPIVKSATRFGAPKPSYGHFSHPAGHSCGWLEGTLEPGPGLRLRLGVPCDSGVGISRGTHPSQDCPRTGTPPPGPTHDARCKPPPPPCHRGVRRQSTVRQALGPDNRASSVRSCRAGTGADREPGRRDEPVTQPNTTQPNPLPPQLPVVQTKAGAQKMTETAQCCSDKGRAHHSRTRGAGKGGGGGTCESLEW